MITLVGRRRVPLGTVRAGLAGSGGTQWRAERVRGLGGARLRAVQAHAGLLPVLLSKRRSRPQSAQSRM
ncbi:MULTISPECIES: hypothetical protein [Parafrankia]|uniref:hypothetical protein n=1 Tax=Parafrankia TaxID=2994362 RepID=UPI000A9B66D0|nr:MULTISPECIES: hypothetical protein [Parafrankia]MBE3202041.1 hypothetical protein [Parafrankia sp. CH37]